MSDIYAVIGLGSMGKRRVRDLKALEAGRVIGVDLREDRRQETEDKFKIEVSDDLEAVLSLKPRVLFVSVAPHLHYRFCKAALDAGSAYFVECLTTLSLEEMDDLIERDKRSAGRAFPSVTPFMNGYFQHTAQAVAQFGKVYAIDASMASWLPNQHPWEKQIGEHYEFDRGKGGGLAEPAYLLSWICGLLGQKPTSVIAHAEHVSDLPPGVNDLLDMIIQFDRGTVMNFHYSLCEKQDRSVGTFTRISCERGTTLSKNTESRFFNWDTQKWDECTLPGSWTYEDIYVEEMKHVLAALDGKEDYQGSLERERWTLATLLAAEESSRKGQRVTIG